MSNINNKNTRLPELQVFSGIAILGVVLIHSNAYYLLHVLNLKSYLDGGFIVRLLDNFIHGSVPMFIFIAGYKYALNNINDEYRKYALKKIKSIIKPFLVISMIYFIKNIIANIDYYNNIKIITIELINMFRGHYNIAYQLWYIPMYIFITLTYPILYKIFKNNKVRLLMIFVIILIQKILGMKISLLSSEPFNFVYYYIFFEMGLIFYKYDIKSKIKKWDIKIISIYIISAVVLTFNPLPRLYNIIQLYMLWPLCIVAYYLLSLRLVNSKILNYLGKYSFYIFLLHEPTICSKISSIFKSIGVYNSIIYVFIVCLLTIIATIILSKIIESTFIKSIIFNKEKNIHIQKVRSDIIKD